VVSGVLCVVEYVVVFQEGGRDFVVVGVVVWSWVLFCCNNNKQKKEKKQKQKTHNSGQTQWREREREKQKTKTNKCVVMEN
jgi:hypothetical protein